MKKILFISLFLLFSAGCVENYENKAKIPEKTQKNVEISENFSEKNEEYLLFQVVEVFDGDTYKVMVNGKLEKIRAIGIDTPEVDGGYKTAECYGDDASEYAKEKLLGKKVGLLRPKNYDDKDRYGRLLRYVFVDGEDFGAHLLKEGYASAYKKFSHPRKNYYLTLEKTAQEEEKGMWSPENCSFWGQEF